MARTSALPLHLTAWRALLRMEGKLGEAERLARECLAIRQPKLPDDWRSFAGHSSRWRNLAPTERRRGGRTLLRSGCNAGMCQRQDRIPAESKLHCGKDSGPGPALRRDRAPLTKAAEWKRELDELEHTGKGQNLAVIPFCHPSSTSIGQVHRTWAR